MPENDPEDGRRQVSNQTILEAVQELEPKATTSKVAEAVGFQSRQAADYRLRNLEDEGRVSSDMVARTKLWTVEDD